MYSPTFIDEVYAKATDEAANTVREYKNKLEMFFDVMHVISKTWF